MAIVDIVIPVYNQADSLPQCLDSIFSQTVHDFSVTVVDDGSQELVAPMLGPYAKKITLIRQPNGGAAAARNRGAKEGTAPYILFCDADCILNKKFLLSQLTTLQKNKKNSYAYSNFFWGHKAFRPGKFTPERLRREPYINTHSLLRREHFPGFDETLKRFQDWDLWLTMLEAGHTGVWIDEVLFTVRPGGTMSTWLPKAAYTLLPWLPVVRKYNEAKSIVQTKHSIGK